MAFKNFILCACTLLFALPLFAQTATMLKVIDKNEQNILVVKNGETVRIVALDSFKMAHKFKGQLNILNDSIIQINSDIVHIRSIFKVGNITTDKSRKGKVLLAVGFICYGAGAGLIAAGYNANTTVTGRNKGAIGSWGIVLGTLFCTIGAKAIHGNPKIVSSDRRVVISF